VKKAREEEEMGNAMKALENRWAGLSLLTI
jgi:hypothetical protein